jgi:hypothetical protein
VVCRYGFESTVACMHGMIGSDVGTSDAVSVDEVWLSVPGRALCLVSARVQETRQNQSA